MATYVTLQQAKDHLKITTPPGDAGDADLFVKLDSSEAIVLDYLKTQTPTVAPALLVPAILLQFGELFRFRGDDADGPQQTAGDLSPVVTNLLRRSRDPALA